MRTVEERFPEEISLPSGPGGVGEDFYTGGVSGRGRTGVKDVFPDLSSVSTPTRGCTRCTRLCKRLSEYSFHGAPAPLPPLQKKGPGPFRRGLSRVSFEKMSSIDPVPSRRWMSISSRLHVSVSYCVIVSRSEFSIVY